MKNQLDRYKRPVEWEERIGEDLTKQAIPIFREISVRDAKLENGKRGAINIAITETPRPKEELDKENIENDKELSQAIDVSPEFIRQIDFDVEIVANSSVKKTKAQQLGEARAFMLDALSAPQVLNPQYAAKEYVKSLGKREDEALAKPTEANPLEQMMGGKAGAQKEQPTPSPAQSGAPDSIESIMNTL